MNSLPPPASPGGGSGGGLPPRVGMPPPMPNFLPPPPSSGSGFETPVLPPPGAALPPPPSSSSPCGSPHPSPVLPPPPPPSFGGVSPGAPIVPAPASSSPIGSPHPTPPVLPPPPQPAAMAAAVPGVSSSLHPLNPIGGVGSPPVLDLPQPILSISPRVGGGDSSSSAPSTMDVASLSRVAAMEHRSSSSPLLGNGGGEESSTLSSSAPSSSSSHAYEALYDFAAQETGDLSFSKGDVILVSLRQGNWWTGTVRRTGHSGRFPKNYVEPLAADAQSSASSSSASASSSSLARMRSASTITKGEIKSRSTGSLPSIQRVDKWKHEKPSTEAEALGKLMSLIEKQDEKPSGASSAGSSPSQPPRRVGSSSPMSASPKGSPKERRRLRRLSKRSNSGSFSSSSWKLEGKNSSSSLSSASLDISSLEARNINKKLTKKKKAKPVVQFSVLLSRVLSDLESSEFTGPVEFVVVPFVEKACLYVEQFCLDVEGLFRTSAPQEDIERSREILDGMSDACIAYDFRAFSPHLACSLLKLYLGNLPDAVLTNRMAGQFIASSSREEIVALVAKLPRAHACLLERIVKCMHMVTTRSSVNKMTANNLARVLGPCLLPEPAGSADLQQAAKYYDDATRLCELLIEFHGKISEVVKYQPTIKRYGRVSMDWSGSRDGSLKVKKGQLVLLTDMPECAPFESWHGYLIDGRMPAKYGSIPRSSVSTSDV